MTNDVEEQVREELAASAHGWIDRIDHDRVLTDGRRALRRRSLRRAAMVTGAVAAIAVLGWAGLASGFGRSATPAVVATPSPAPSTVALNRVTFDLSGVRGANYARLEITLTTDGTLWMSGMATDGDVRFTSSIEALYASTHGVMTDVGVPVVVGLIPGTPRWIMPVTTGSTGVVSDVRRLPAGDESVYLVVFGSGKAPRLAGVCWGGVDGEVHESSGTSLASTALDFDGHRGTFFFTDFEDVSRLMFHGDSGNSFSFEANGSRYRPYFSSEHDSAGARSMAVALLPWNATDPAVDLADPSATWTTLEVAGRTVVVVSGTSDTMAGMVRSMSYTDATDGRVTRPVR